MSLLIINAGSSTLKFSCFSRPGMTELASGLVDWKGDRNNAEVSFSRPGFDKQVFSKPIADYRAAMEEVLAVLDKQVPDHLPVEALGHRIVHGGSFFTSSVRIDAGVMKKLAKLNELAPLHNPPALEAVEATRAALPDIPMVAAFDTAFFASLPPRAFVYPLPHDWFTAWGIRRFGFHGLSHDYCTGRAAEILGNNSLRLVICHLGNGCSATGVQAGRALNTTMGFTPLEGLMMGTRSGSIDPGILFHVLSQGHVKENDLSQILNHQSGLLGVSGVSSDYREVESAAGKGNERARLALTMFADRIRGTIASLAVGMGGLDVLVFTAGIGENSATLRREVCGGLECLGLVLDPRLNEKCKPDADVAAAGSSGRILVIHTREELVIARETQRLTKETLPPAPSSPPGR